MSRDNNPMMTPELLDAAILSCEPTNSGFLFRFDVNAHATTLLKNLHHLHICNNLVDVVLVSEEMEEFAFHGALLAAVSPVFRKLFVQSPLQFKSLSPRGVSSADIFALQRYIYMTKDVVNTSYNDSPITDLDFAHLCQCERIDEGFVDPEQLLTTLHAMYKRCELTNFVVKSSGKELPCHGEILASSCSVLLDRIVQDPVPLLDCVINFDDVTPEVMQILVDYIYSAEILLCDDNVVGVTTAAARWHLPALSRAGCDYLNKKLHPSTAIGCAQFANKLLEETSDAAICQLDSEVSRYIVCNLKQVLLEDEFFTIATRTDIEMAVLSQQASYSLVLVLEKTIKWYAWSKTNREKDFITIVAGLCYLHCRDKVVAVMDRSS